MLLLPTRRVEVVVGWSVRARAEEARASVAVERVVFGCSSEQRTRSVDARPCILCLEVLILLIFEIFLSRRLLVLESHFGLVQGLGQVHVSPFGHFCSVVLRSPHHVVGKRVLGVFFLLFRQDLRQSLSAILFKWFVGLLVGIEDIGCASHRVLHSLGGWRSPCRRMRCSFFAQLMLGKYPVAERLVLLLLFLLFKSSFILTRTLLQTSCLGARSWTSPFSVVDDLEQESIATRLEASDIFWVVNDFLDHFLAGSGHSFVLCEHPVNLANDHRR